MDILFNTNHQIVFAHNAQKILGIDGMTYHFNSSGSSFGNTMQLYDYISGYEGIGEWEEIPVLSPNTRGLLQATQNGFEELKVGNPYLMIGKNDNNEDALLANASDRYEEYLHHRLYMRSEGVTYEIWCIADFSNIVDGTTAVYGDEECTNQVGVIQNHQYNPNNPYDCEILADGETFVFTWDPTDYPEALATTYAVIEAAKKKTSVLGNAVYYKPNGSGAWVKASVTWNGSAYTCAPATTQHFIVVVTVDDAEPAADYSNASAMFAWTLGATFGVDAVLGFTSAAHGDGMITISL